MTTEPAHTTRSGIDAWHSLPVGEVLARVRSVGGGLSALEAARRLAADGPNELREARPVRPWSILLGQFKSVIVWILIVAGLISSVLGEPVDAIAIVTIVILNAVIGFQQEYSAEKSIAALKKMTAPRARVVREGRVVSLPASEIVVGDVLEFEAGDLVAADARLIKESSLRCNEASLTGESDAVEKDATMLGDAGIPPGDRKNMVFMGTSIALGQGSAVVVATGMDTEMGRIAGLIEEAGASAGTPLHQKLDAFGRTLVWVSLGMVALIFGLGWVRGMNMFELFMTSVSLAVAAVPEGLPAVVTVSLALGVVRMSRRRALVRKLPAVEALGATTVICTDKTGTLTVGEMTVRSLHVAGQTYEVTGEGYGPHGEVRFEGRTSDARHAGPLLELAMVLLGGNNARLEMEEGTWRVIGDPTEGALAAAGHKAGGVREHIERDLPRQHEIPFDSDRKRRTVIRRMPDGRLRAFINGAPDVLLSHCTRIYTGTGIRAMSDEDRQGITAQNATMANQALRVLGSAYRDLDEGLTAPLVPGEIERDLVFVGLAGMYDPPRPEAKEAVARCRVAGIRVVMITGDHPHTATAIARELGIAASGDLAVTGVELDRMSDEALREMAPRVAVYARVTPEHKLRIVRAWKANEAVVAMTGDGVNDAPAIRGADIGIAMGRSGTEVTKQASVMVVTDDNFASIVAAVEEGRGIYDNIRKTLQYLLAGNCGELLLMTVSVLIGLPSPLLPIHLLWINLVTDGLPALCLATDPIDSDVMKRRPRPRVERITDGGFLGTMFLTGILTAGVSLAVYAYGLRTETETVARTHAFSVLVFAELLRSFGCRSETRPLWRMAFLSNVHLAVVVALSFGLQVLIQHNATLARFLKTSLMNVPDSLLLLVLSAIPLAVLEIVKFVRQRPPHEH